MEFCSVGTHCVGHAPEGRWHARDRELRVQLTNGGGTLRVHFPGLGVQPNNGLELGFWDHYTPQYALAGMYHQPPDVISVLFLFLFLHTQHNRRNKTQKEKLYDGNVAFYNPQCMNFMP